MKQVLQNIRDGRLSVADVPAPVVRPGHVVIANQASLISAGTEKMVMDLAGKSLLGKARERPDHVRRVLEKVRNEGLLNTVRAVREKLDEPMTMGYSSAGIVLACGSGVQHYKPGDRVASNGSHAEVVCVPVNLTAAVPENVPSDHAAFAVLGAIALQGIRLGRTELGESVLVIGLGLVGQLCVGLLSAAGCRVIGTDPDPARCALARVMGASVAEPGLSAHQVEELTGGLGADAVIIAASTQSNAPIELAAAAVRKRGRVVLVGVVGLELDRRPFYFKEAEFVVSCSYGPGRYDPDYEELGHDYPAAWVRWTEQRNIAAVLQAIASGRLNVEPLISQRFPIERAEEAYQCIRNADGTSLGILLQYDAQKNHNPARTIWLDRAGASGSDTGSPVSRLSRDAASSTGRIRIGVLGAGNFARMVLLPQIAACSQLEPVALCSAAGIHAAHSGQRHGFQRVTSDEGEILGASDIDAVFSITRHDLHATQVLSAIRAGQHIFVEKPLCLTVDELQEIETALAAAGNSAPLVMVGFNRRFAPLATELRAAFARTTEPLTVCFRFNAGAIPADHWTQQQEIGGGRIIGEACHAIDFVTWLTGSLPVRVYAESAGDTSSGISDDQCFITLRHANGSISSIAYLAGGDRSCPKERIEVMGGGVSAILDDFREVTVYQQGRRRVKRGRQDKGHAEEIRRFASALTHSGPAPVSWSELYSTTLASMLAVQSLREGVPFDIPECGGRTTP